MSMKKPAIALTMGDAGGIGPEIIIKAVLTPSVRRLCRIIVVGDFGVLAACAGFAPRPVRLLAVEKLGDIDGTDQAVPVLSPCRALGRHRWGRVSKAYGRAAMAFVRFAALEALAGRLDAVVTAPICKEAIHRAGFPFEGHTDYLAHLTGAKRYAMMLMGRGLRVVLVTVHQALSGVSRKVTRAKVLDTIRLARDACLRLGLKRARVGVCALNPHAGESGAFGREEIDAITPAIRAARREGIDACGPHPADTIFVPSHAVKFDVIVAMYHDQGLIPLKMRAFDVGVNVTLGLPIVRTSPDHGTAFSIAGRGEADPRSMIEAIKAAATLSRSSHG